MSTYLWLPTTFSVHSQMPEKTADIFFPSLLNTPKTVPFVCVLNVCVCVPACWQRMSVVPVWFSPVRSAVLPSQLPARYPGPSYPPQDCLTSWTPHPREDSQNCWDYTEISQHEWKESSLKKVQKVGSHKASHNLSFTSSFPHRFDCVQVFIIKKQLAIAITMLSRVSVCNPLHIEANT